MPAQTNTDHIRVLQNEILRRQASRDFLTFVKLMHEDPAHPDDFSRTTYEVQPVHHFLADAFQRVERGDYKGKIVLISTPPRIGKTTLFRLFTAWFMGRNPEKHFIYATYNDDFAKTHGGVVRELMKHPRFRLVFPGFKFERGAANNQFQRTWKKGEAKFAGRGGSLTGRGYHIGGFDDLVKDAEEANSPVTRNKMWDWFISTFYSRKMTSESTTIGVATRWHEDDPMGRLTDPNNPAYDPVFRDLVVEINIPMMAYEDDPLGREIGEILWPGRFSKEDMDTRKAADPRMFSALYQGRPSPEDGDFFKREYVRFYNQDELPPLDQLRIFAASDHAVSQKQTSDYTVLLIVGADEYGRIYLLDCLWERLDTMTAVERMIDFMEKYRPLFWWAEKGHISKSIMPFLFKRMMERGTFCAVEEHTPASDKLTRAQPIQARMAMRHVYFPKNGYWVSRAIDELMKFPNGTHDDFVDALAWIGIHLIRVMGVRSGKDAPVVRPGTFRYLDRQEKRRTRLEEAERMRKLI